MASPFELLEAYVAISERGAAVVEATLARIEATMKRVTATPVEVSIAATSSVQAAATAAATSMTVAATAAQAVEAAVQGVGTALATVATPAINAFRGHLTPIAGAFNDVEDAVFELVGTTAILPQMAQNTALVAVNAGKASTALVAMGGAAQQLTILQRIGQSLAAWGSYIGNAVSQTFAFNNALNQSLGTLGKFATLAAAIKVGILGFQEAASEQKTFIAFEAILQDGEAAKKILQDIDELAQGTPFPVANIRATVQQLLALGTTQEKVMEEFMMLAEIAAGVGAPIEQIARAYTQVRSKQQLYAEELQQLGDAGVPILQELADMMGRSTREVRALAQAGELGFPELEAAFKRMTSEGGKFNGIVAQTTFLGSGGLNKLKDAAADLAIELGTAFNLGGAEDNMRGLVALVEAVGDGIAGWNSEVATFERALGRMIGDEGFKFQSLFSAVGEALRFEEEMNALAANMSRPTGGTDAVVEIEQLSGRWRAMNVDVKEYLEAVSKANKEIAKMWERQDGVPKWWAEMIKDSGPLKIMLDSLKDPSISMADDIRNSVLTPLEELEAKLRDIRHVFSKELINDEVYKKAIKEAVDETDKLLEKQDEIRKNLAKTSFTVGTTQAFTFKLESASAQQQLRKTDEQIRAQEIGNRYLKEIADGVKELKFEPEVTEQTFEGSDLF